MYKMSFETKDECFQNNELNKSQDIGKDTTEDILLTHVADGDSKKDEQESNEDSVTPDDILYQLGGCGRYQALLAIVIQLMKTVVCWGMVGNIFISFVPRWRCIDDVGVFTNITERLNTSLEKAPEDSDDVWNRQCKLSSGQTCKSFEFERDIRTIVSRFDLVCDQSWVTASIVSMQMTGMCVGSVVAGHVADTFGRKKPLILSMSILSVCHFVSYFSVNWVMFGVARIFIGFGSSIYLSIYCIAQSEYILSKWRSIVIGFPSWALESSLFALAAWLLHDWANLTIAMSIMALLFISAWGFVPESFRWFIAKQRYNEAKLIVINVAKWNKQPEPDFEQMHKAVAAQQQNKTSQRYTVLELFRRRALLKLTIPLMICWLSMGFISYGIGFGIQKLSGNIYLNIFLFSIASLPSKVISIYLQNKLGRKKASIIAFSVCLIGGLTVGIVQYIDTPHRDSLTNYFALAANVGVDGTWGPMQTLTVELYPTVLRNNGFGFLSMLARLGAVIGPQFVYLSEMVPGILYFMVAVTSLLSIVATICVTETMDTTLVDNMADDLETMRKKEHSI